MSISRAFAQRNTNVTNIIPDYTDGFSGILRIDPRNCSVFNIDLSNAQFLESQTVNYATNIEFVQITNAKVYYFHIDAYATNAWRELAMAYPGLEFTLNFTVDWELDNFNNSFISLYYDDVSCDILSPYSALYNYKHNSVTMKSNGDRFTVTGSGPQAWAIGAFAC